jgi:hypothetical protein
VPSKLSRGATKSILNIHIEPPAFDLLPAALLAFSPSADIHGLKAVDMRLMVLMGARLRRAGKGLIFAWTAQLTGSGPGCL